MFEAIMNALIKELADTKLFKQVEPYEGQFEDLKQFTILMPAVFSEFVNFQEEPGLVVNARLIIAAPTIKGRKNLSMLSLMDKLRDLLKNRNLEDESGYLCRIEFTGFDRLAIFPGFNTYQLYAKLVR